MFYGNQYCHWHHTIMLNRRLHNLVLLVLCNMLWCRLSNIFYSFDRLTSQHMYITFMPVIGCYSRDGATYQYTICVDSHSSISVASHPSTLYYNILVLFK
ncbi:hypothetical protein EB796_009619 [Bugula neritina]|uniref:Uncharacterized protein n=1 Tax=Bugula neritina TaxID=10212 RepID=A0A7J7K0G2_BUGNE|nr:hypothetical protein EB796_009619 [Bugula neritina]